MSLSDYSGMEKEINDAPEPHVLPRGKEAKVRIVRVQPGISDKAGSEGARWFMPYFDCPDDPLVKEFNTFLDDPLTLDRIADPKRKVRALATFKLFTKCFHVDISKPFSWEDDLPGKEGWIIPGIATDDQYGDKNTVSKYITGPAGAAGTPVDEDDIPF